VAGKDKLVVKIGGDSSELKGAVAQANSTLSGFVNQAKSFGGALVAGFAFSEIAAGIQKVVRMAGESVDGEARLITALKGRVEVQERLLNQADLLASTTLFEDDAIIKQEQILASMGLTEKQIMKTISAAVQLSSVYNVELGAATEALAKSYFGVGKSLASISPEFKALTAEQLKNGEAIDLVLKKYEGFAESLTSIGSGPLKQFEKQMGELQEASGKLILPAVNPVLERFTSIIKGLTNDDISPWIRLSALFSGSFGINELGKLNEALEKRNALLANTVPLGPNPFDISPTALGIAPEKTKGTGAATGLSPALIKAQNEATRLKEMIKSITTGPIPQISVDTNPFVSQMSNMRQAWTETKERMAADFAEMQAHYTQMANVATASGEVIGAALVGAFSGDQGLGQLRQATVSIVNLFQQQALAAIVAKATKDGVFKPGVGTFVAIAAATAGFAAIKALFSKIGATGGGAGGGGGYGGGAGGGGTRFESLGQRIELVGQVAVSGTQLNIALSNQARLDNRTKAG